MDISERGKTVNFWEPANFLNNECSLPTSPAQKHLVRLRPKGRCPPCFLGSTLGHRGPLAGRARAAKSQRSGKTCPFPLVSSPDEYYSTTYNIYKSSSQQFEKDVRNQPLFKLGKDMKPSLSGTVLCFLKIVHRINGPYFFQ